MPSALAFATLAEAAAGASLALFTLVSFALAAPGLASARFVDPGFWGWVGVIHAGFVALMVGLHLLWALCLEGLLFCTKGGPRVPQSVCFALYACGWDLVTSPLGLLLAVAGRGRRLGFALVRAAAQAPRASLGAYLVEQRGVRVEFAWPLALASLLVPMLMLGTSAFLGTLSWWLT